MARPKQRTPELRARLLDAALATLAEDGVGGFTTRKVALGASTSIPAVYELFGDRAGLVREMFFEGFRRLGAALAVLAVTADARADLERLVDALRAFGRANPVLSDVMFARPFADFDPGPEERAAGDAVRRRIVGHVRRCVEAGDLVGDPIDIAHAVLALAQGLSAQESAGWLGTSKASVNRRWELALRALLDGFASDAHA